MRKKRKTLRLSWSILLKEEREKLLWPSLIVFMSGKEARNA